MNNPQPIQLSRPLPSCTILAVFCICLFVCPVWSQDGDSTSFPPTHPLTFGLGLGDSPAPDTKVYDLRVPIFISLIPMEERPWGLRLKVTLYAGVYDFFVNPETDIQVRFQSLAATPGVEFLVPVGGGWILKPFAEVGYARDFDNDLGFGVWSAGMRTIVTWPVNRFDLSLGTKLQYLSTFTSNLKLVHDFGEARVGLDARHPLPFTIAGSQGDLSLYYIRRQYIDAIISSEEGEPIEIQASNEIGFTFGTTPKIKLWIVKLPRIGIGYRWGQNVRGWRLNFGFPF